MKKNPVSVKAEQKQNTATSDFERKCASNETTMSDEALAIMLQSEEYEQKKDEDYAKRLYEKQIVEANIEDACKKFKVKRWV